jgi:hypothetical protein
MSGLIEKIRKRKGPTVKNNRNENPYAMVAEFPREKIFDGELKLLLMDGSVEIKSRNSYTTSIPEDGLLDLDNWASYVFVFLQGLAY